MERSLFVITIKTNILHIHRANIMNVKCTFLAKNVYINAFNGVTMLLFQEILERGLTFITTPSLPDRDLLRRDLHTYHRRLKILDYFKYNTDYFYLPFTTPSIWEPALKSVSKPIRQLIDQDLRSFRDLRPRRPVRGGQYYCPSTTGPQQTKISP